MAFAACGAAFVDRSGAIVAADRGFLSLLGLPEDDPSGALRERVRFEPELAALLTGSGAGSVRVPGAGNGALEVEAVPVDGGVLLLLRGPGSLEVREHALRSRALGAVASGVAHEIRNPLNAISLQIALLAEKLSGCTQADAGRHLGTVREQVRRVDEVVRRLLDAVDPPTLGFADLGAIVEDVAGLLGHEARSHRIAVTVSAPRLSAVTACDPGRVGRLVIGLMARVLAGTPEGGRVAVRVEADGKRTTLLVDHTRGDPAGQDHVGYDVIAAAAVELGGAFAVRREGREQALSLVLPGGQRQ